MREEKLPAESAGAQTVPVKAKKTGTVKTSTARKSKRSLDDSGNGSTPPKRVTRRSSVYGKNPGCSLIQEFDQIIKCARTDAISNDTPPVSCQDGESEPNENPKVEPAEAVSPNKALQSIGMSCATICTPLRPTNVRKAPDSIAPSPITPPLPRRPPHLEEEKHDVAPSPRGMNLSPKSTDQTSHHVAPSPRGMNLNPESPDQSPHHVTQANVIHDDPNVSTEQPFLDALDVTMDIDNIIDEMIKKRSDQEICKTDVSVGLSSIGSLDFSLDSEKSELTLGSEKDVEAPKDQKQLKEEELEQDLFADSDPVAVQSALETENCCPPVSSLPSCTGNKENHSDNILNCEKKMSPEHTFTDPQIPESLCEEELADNVPNLISNEKVILSAGTDEGSPKTLSLVEEQEEKNSQIRTKLSAGIASPLPNSHEEAFCDDLTLSNSQMLDIDEKCITYSEKERISLANPEPVPPQGMVVTNILPAIGFSVPPAPRLGWVQKTLEGRQRLRMITQEISRLNAMVLRARRTIWPRQQATQSSMQQSETVHSSHPTPQATSQMWSQGTPSDPDWNIS